MQELFNKILDSAKKNNACAVATVVSTLGSSPRKIGAKMLIFDDGSIDGTIGGGVLEKMVIADARQALKKRKSFLREYRLDKRSGFAVCGGKVSIFIEVIEPDKRLVVAGAGHIGLALSLIAKLLGFYVVMVDNRRDFANAKRFPHVDEIICDSYKRSIKKVGLDKKSSIVIVTHGHVHDAECLKAALLTSAGYIGMIGSLTKVKLVLNALLKDGFEKSQLSRVHAPIGLDIGAETPQEIAVAIAAQLIQVGRQQNQKF